MTVASQVYCPRLPLTVTQGLNCFKIISRVFDTLAPTLNYAHSASTSHYLRNLVHICNMLAHERTRGGLLESSPIPILVAPITKMSSEPPREKYAHHNPILEGSISFSGSTSFTRLE